MELTQAKAALEAVLFACAEPTSSRLLAEALQIEQSLVDSLLANLQDTLRLKDRGIQLIQLEGAWQLASKGEYSTEIKKALDTRRNSPLTPAALEVLAIIAYNQPVSRSFVEQVRGVDSSSTVANLVQKGLVAEAGRLDLPGRPISFKTTDAFLRSFGISSLGELPPLHAPESPENTADMYALPSGDAFVEEMQVPEPTAALHGGSFFEGAGGRAQVLDKDE